MAMIPRDEKFYELFLEQADCVHDASKKLVSLLEEFEDVQKRVTEIEFLEHRGDQLTHTVMMRLNKTFITPFDREDIHHLASALDDIADYIYACAKKIKLPVSVQFTVKLRFCAVTGISLITPVEPPVIPVSVLVIVSGLSYKL